jgi:hypothetical protein
VVEKHHLGLATTEVLWCSLILLILGLFLLCHYYCVKRGLGRRENGRKGAKFEEDSERRTSPPVSILRIVPVIIT